MNARSLRLLPALALAAGVLACETQPEADTEAVPAAATATPAAVDVAAEEQAIRELDRAWVAGVVARNADSAAFVYTEDAVLMPPNTEAVRGRAAIREWWAGALGSPNFSLTFEPTEIEVAPSGEMAYDVGTYRLTMGNVQDNGKYLVVWEKVNGQWRVAADMFNSNVAAAQ